MAVGYALFPVVLLLVYILPLYYFFRKAKTNIEKFISLSIPIGLTLSIFVVAFVDTYQYKRKKEKHPEYSHISFPGPIQEVKDSIRAFKSFLKFPPYTSTGRPIPFKELLGGIYLSGEYRSPDSLFTNKSAALKNILFLEANEISAIEVYHNVIFVTYRYELSKKEDLYYELLQLNDSSGHHFDKNAFDTIDHKEGLFLLSKVPLN